MAAPDLFLTSRSKQDRAGRSKKTEIAEKPIAALGIVAPAPIQVAFPKFSGSLGQLFACVREQKIDLLDVPLLPICEAYFQYLVAQDAPDLNESAAALAALAFLLERKAWRLLPIPETKPDEPEVLELAERSVHEYLEAISFLREGFERRSELFFRAPNQSLAGYELPIEIESLEVQALSNAFARMLERMRPPTMKSVARAGRMLADEMRSVLRRIQTDWEIFDALLPTTATREDAVYVFLSLLELMRLGQVVMRIVDAQVEFSLALGRT
jgi:segregation and condensation protein A